MDITTPKGFEALYNRYWETVFAVCYANTGEVSLSKGMAQEIFTSIWERRAVLEIKKSHENYLVRAARLKVFEHYRKVAAQKEAMDCAIEDYCASAHCTEDDVAYSLLLEELDLLVDELPCQCRNVFKMSREQGMSTQEIAKKLQISQRAVQYHLNRATGFLKKSLRQAP